MRCLSGDWALGPDEALVVDIDADDTADYWSVVLMGIWGETVDWRSRPAVVNHDTPVRRPDGTVRIVIAHREPAAPNWLDTAGHPQGSVALRWFRSVAPLPTARTRVVAHDEVSA